MNIYHRLNQVKNRIVFLSPTVENCLEREARFSDFMLDSSASLGKGGFGEVLKAKHKMSDNHFALKVLEKEKIIKSNLVDQVNKEIDILYRCNHPHIIRLINHFEDEENVYLVLEFAENGNLFNKLKNKKRFQESEVAQFGREVLAALIYLHTNFEVPIVHRDIKPENILLDSNDRVKLCDFGWASFIEAERKTYCGTPEYLPPEILLNKTQSEKVDMWSYGVLLFELLNGSTPFNARAEWRIFKNIANRKIKWLIEVGKEAKDLIEKLLDLKEEERATSIEIADHPFFQTYPKQKPDLERKKFKRSDYLKSLCLMKKDKPEENPLELELINKYKDIIIKMQYDHAKEIKQLNTTASKLEEQLKEHQASKKREQGVSIKSLEESNREWEKKYSTLSKMFEAQEKEILELKNKLNRIANENMNLIKEVKFTKIDACHKNYEIKQLQLVRNNTKSAKTTHFSAICLENASSTVPFSNLDQNSEDSNRDLSFDVTKAELEDEVLKFEVLSPTSNRNSRSRSVRDEAYPLEKFAMTVEVFSEQILKQEVYRAQLLQMIRQGYFDLLKEQEASNIKLTWDSVYSNVRKNSGEHWEVIQVILTRMEESMFLS